MSIDPAHPIHKCALELLDGVVRDFARFAPELLDAAIAVAAERRGRAPGLPLVGGTANEAPRYPRSGARWRVPIVRQSRSRTLPAEAGERARRLSERRRLACRDHLPHGYRGEFTDGERAVLAAVAIFAHGRRSITAALAAIAERAFVSASTVRSTLKKAARLGLLTVTVRPIKGRRHETNLISIACSTWQSWLARRFGIGSKIPDAIREKKDSSLTSRVAATVRKRLDGLRELGRRTRNGPEPAG